MTSFWGGKKRKIDISVHGRGTSAIEGTGPVDVMYFLTKQALVLFTSSTHSIFSDELIGKQNTVLSRGFPSLSTTGTHLVS